MPKDKAKADEVAEEESSVVDETTEQETAETEEVAGDQPAAETAPEGTEAAAEDDAAEGEEAAQEGEEAAAAEAEPSAEEIKAENRIAALEAELARIKEGQQPAKTEPAAKPSHIQAFVQRAVPELKKAFMTEGATPEQQFEAVYKMADQMLGSVMADHVEPIQDHLATKVINLENELEIRDLRADAKTGTLFGTLEKAVREELKKLPWKDRVTEGAVRKIYHRLLGERNGAPLPPKINGNGHAATATAALRDVSAGNRTQPAKKVTGFKLSPEQEADFQAMVEDGAAITRERYAARYKARADKAKAEKRPIPKTLRSFR